MDRRLLDGETTPVGENRNVFDDEFEAEDFDGVADGFRPSDHDREGGMRSHGRDATFAPVRTTSVRSTRSTRSSASTVTREPSGAYSRSSMRKSRGQDNPFASPEDDERTPSLTFEPDITHRSVSSASSSNFAGTGSPRFGAGPSHPYGMYPQGTIPRSPSIATQSTVRASVRHSISQDGPQHPYTMYPQGVGEEDDDDHAPQNLVPVGFPGLGQSYQRRLGPEGEEQDIIGEDGHTEQLPPYTRYPEDGPEKMPLLTAPSAPTALHSRAPVAGTDPTMALMHDSLRPPPTPRPQSMMDASTLRGSRAPSLANVEAMTTQSTSKSLLSYKSWSEKSWKEKRKTKFCGIPFWWILLSVSVVVFIATVLGGVIGGFVMNQNQKTQNILAQASSTLYDASAIPTPAISPPTGTFQLPLSTPQETQAACLTETGQQAAWSCDLAGQAQQGINIYQPPGSNQTGAQLFYGSPTVDNQISYGAQQSFMNTNFAPFIAVQDNDAPKDGPAFYFQQFYDKVVVVPETALTAPGPGGKSKRQSIQLNQGWMQQKQVVQPGQKPWFCVWNNTFVEGFIYVQQPVVVTSYSPVQPPPTPAPNATAASTTTSGTGATPPAGSPTAFITTTVTMPSQTATFTGPAEGLPHWSAHVFASQSSTNNGKSYSNGQTTDDGDNDKYKRQAPPPPIDYANLAQYPFVVKIEERRLSGNTITPYCQQYQILDDGGYGMVVQPGTQNPIIVQLNEQDPSYSAYQSAGMAGSKMPKRGLVARGCHCQWMSGQSS
ncbi:hypothetical protein LTR86_002432 [Recurvomyces mirabilis]|nr:hypothetical protein LTR86_002432 [Recurvomyces mirabilis]